MALYHAVQKACCLFVRKDLVAENWCLMSAESLSWEACDLGCWSIPQPLLLKRSVLLAGGVNDWQSGIL